MALLLSTITTQQQPQFTSVTCRLSDEISLQAAIYAPPEVLGVLRPRPGTFLYLSYLVALRLQTPLTVDCDVSQFEWLNFVHNFIPLASAFYSLPEVPAIRVGGLAEHVPSASRTARTGLMFSGGVDSFYTLLSLQEANQKPDYLISINAGAFPDRRVWSAILPLLGEVGRKCRTPLILIDTNFHKAFPRTHLSSHTVRNMTAAMLLRPALSTAFYSSSTTLADALFTRAKEIQDMSSIEAMVLYTMQQSDFGALIYGLNTERIEKTRAIHTAPIVQQHLNVCTNWRYQISADRTVINCGRCSKCARTMLTLEALGSLQHYGRSFELADFAQGRAALLSRLKESHYRIDHSVIEFIENG